MPIFMSWLPRPFRDTFDLRAQIEELAFDVLIPPPNVVRAVNRRRALGRQGGQDQRGARAQVADLDFGAAQRRGPVIAAWCASRSSTSAPMRRSSRQPVEAILEDRLVDVATCRWPG